MIKPKPASERSRRLTALAGALSETASALAATGDRSTQREAAPRPSPRQSDLRGSAHLTMAKSRRLFREALGCCAKVTHSPWLLNTGLLNRVQPPFLHCSALVGAHSGPPTIVVKGEPEHATITPKKSTGTASSFAIV
jgi:hypothetical protein